MLTDTKISFSFSNDKFMISDVESNGNVLSDREATHREIYDHFTKRVKTLTHNIRNRVFNAIDKELRV